MAEHSRVKPRQSALHAEHRQRVKNKLLKFGFEPFSEHEVLELLLFYALPHVDTNEMAHELINKAGSFVGVFDLTLEEMKSVSGIKEQAAIFLKFIHELIDYYYFREYIDIQIFPAEYKTLAEICVRFFSARASKNILCIYLDKQNEILNAESIGEYNSLDIERPLRRIIKRAIELSAVNIAVGHAEPILGLVPFTNDIAFSVELERQLSEVNLCLIEHFIVSDNKYMGILEEHRKILSM